MTAARTLSPRRARARSRARHASRRVCVLVVIAAALPAPAAMAATTTQDILGAKIPASVHIKSTASTTKPTTTTAPASAATTTAATSTAATSTSAAGGAQPGTVAPSSTATTPAAAAPATTAPTTTPTTSTPTGTTRAGSTTVVAVGKAKAKSKRLSVGALVLAILGALLALGAIAWAVARWLALEPRWTVSLVYSLREANSRASATWAEFSDWVRLGR